jgi:hypothetical protein
MRDSGRLAALAVLLLVAGSWLPLACSSGGGAGARGGVYLSADTLETTVDVRKGGRYFFSIGADNRITPMPVPDMYAGMPPEVARAVDRAPQWLREDLAAKLLELASAPLERGPDTRIAAGDIDGDGDLDLAAAAGTRVALFWNEGTIWSPLFVRDPSRDGTFSTSGPLPGPDINTPALGDLNGDGRAEIILGAAVGQVYFGLMGNEPLNVSVPGPAAPALGDLDGDGDLDLAVGDGLGKVHYFENTGNRTQWRFQVSASSLLFSAVAVPGPAVPSLSDLDGDGDLDCAVGAGNGMVHYFQNLGTPTVPAFAPDDPLRFLGETASGRAAPCLAKLGGDNRTDLCLGQTGGPVLFIRNTGSTASAQWESYPFYEYTPKLGYYDPHSYVQEVNYSRVLGYADALNSIEQRCVDELAFSVAHSAVEALRASSPGVYAENARSIYKNDEFLDYVQVVDYPDHSTTKYRVNESGRISSYELPRDIYYWYIVHPKITDEIPLHIDPDAASGSANESAPPPVGKFWRDWLLFNADAAYPPDPVNATVHYPKTMAPPLLKDLLAGVTTLWNCTRYSSPGGFDNEGINNSHPADYGDHAIEKVSWWVMKTLPLNEQDSGDGERPIQPVRIARGHNGNCGELGDLTVAASRACLIPAVQISLLAEDHVWMQFYDRGWHQWDNYWSDGGAVIDDFMNYWIGWYNPNTGGPRGGSGVSGWRGDDFSFEVTENYIPPVSQSHVTVNVKDSAGYPVDGARVVMASHWLAESRQQREMITYPFPAIWNFTDGNGSTTFVLAHNNFTIDVVSKLGHAALNKTWIGEGQIYSFNFTLPGRLPSPTPSLSSSPNRPPGKLQLEYNYSVERGEQRPPNPEVMTTSVQPISSELRLASFICDEANFTKYLSGQVFFGEVYVQADQDFIWPSLICNLTENETWYLVLFNENTLETSKTVHVKLELRVLHETPGIVIDYPVGGTTVDGARPIPVTGRVLGGSPVASLELRIDGGRRENITSALDRLTGKWRWEADLTALSSGRHVITAFATDTLGYESMASAAIGLDKLPPKAFIDAPPAGTIFGLDELIEFRGRASDDTAVAGLSYRIDGLPFQDITASLRGADWNFSHPGGVLLAGKHTVEVRAVDVVGRSGNATLDFELRDERPPEVGITSPAEGETFEMGQTVVLEGTARDDSKLASLTLDIGGRMVDLLPSLDQNGGWRYSWDSSGRADAGEVAFSAVALDDSGNRAGASRVFRLSDTRAPAVELLLPGNGTVFRPGDPVNISGTCSDNVGVVRLEARLGSEGWRTITSSLRDGKFGHLFDTADLPPGSYNITVRAHDGAGNTGTDEGYVKLEAPHRKPAGPASKNFIPGAGPAALLAAAAVLAAAGRLRRRKRED